MSNRLQDLVDVARLQQLTDDLYEVSGIPSAIIATGGEVLTHSGWKRICADFHRKHPEVEKECAANNIEIGNKCTVGGSAVHYTCPWGLANAAVPIVIEGEHLANVFAGQLFLHPPDQEVEQRFRDNARVFGFEEHDYLAAFREVPVIQEDRFRSVLKFLTRLAQMVAENGLQRKRELEFAAHIKESEERFRMAAEMASDLIYEREYESSKATFFGDIDTIQGYPAGGYPRELAGFFEHLHPDEIAEYLRVFADHGPSPDILQSQFRLRHADGSYVEWEESGRHLFNKEGVPAKWLGVARDVTRSRAAEAALARSEEKYRLLAENITDLIWTMDLAERFTYLSPSVVKIWGYVPEEPSNITLRETLTTESYEFAVRIMAEEMARDGDPGVDPARVREFQIEQIRGDGSTVWTEVTAKFLRNDQGAITGVIGSTRDISDRRKAETALRLSEERLNDLIHSLADWVWEVDASGRYTYSSPKVIEYFGLTPDEMIGKTPFDFMASQEAEKISQIFAGIAAVKGPIKDLENWNIMKNGEKICLLTNGVPLLDEAGNLIGYRGVDKDITSRKRAEILLETRLELSEKLANADMDTLLQRTLDAVEFLTGSTIGFFHFVDPDQRSLRLQTWSTNTLSTMCKADGKGAHYPISQAGVWADCFYTREPVIHNDFASLPYKKGMPEGHADVIRELVVPMVKDDRVVAILGVGNKPVDYTEQDVRTVQSLASMTMEIVSRKRAEMEKEQLSEKLRQSSKMEAVGRLAGGVAHDFNNLLTIIKGHCDLIMSDLSEHDPILADAAEIKAAGNRAAALTSQLLAFSRRQVISPRVVDLNALLSDLLKMLKRLIGEDVELVFQPGADLGRVLVDPNQMEQVLVNLAINARDAMPEGGALTVATSNVEVGAEQTPENWDGAPGRYVLLSVMDSGCGIPPQIKEHLFEPFYTTKEKGKGTGLGLSMVYGAIKQSSGEVIVESEVGAGTRFDIYLPFRSEEEMPRIRQTTMGSPTGSEVVLLVEDEETVRNLATRILQRQGYQVLTAETPGQALSIAASPDRKFDLILTDVIMPGMNGLKLYQQIEVFRPKVPVLFMSGYTEDVVSTHGILDLETNFIAKPFTVDSLAKKVRSVLDRHSAR